jgi:hypothetical protein
MDLNDLEWDVRTNISGRLHRNVNYATIVGQIHVILDVSIPKWVKNK